MLLHESLRLGSILGKVLLTLPSMLRHSDLATPRSGLAHQGRAPVGAWMIGQ